MVVEARETFEITRELINDLEDEGCFEDFEMIEESVIDYDIYIGYVIIQYIIKRLSDNKYFRFSLHSCLDDNEEWDQEAIEVFPYTHEVTGYL